MNHRDTETQRGATDETLVPNRHPCSFPVSSVAKCLLCVSMSLWFNAVSGAQEPPLANRPAQFSNIVGSYSIEVRATPREVPVEEPVTLHVTLTGKGPAKYQPDRKHLKLFPESWAGEFYIEPVPDQDRASPEEGTWDLVYRLRPKHTKATAIDGIKLVYYDPAARKYQTRYAEPIEITVKPRQPAPELPGNLLVKTAPASFYELASAESMQAVWSGPWTLPAWALVGSVVGSPLLSLVGVWLVRRFGRAGRRRHERSAAAGAALESLTVAHGEPVWQILARYLRERVGYPAAEATPDEVRRFLRRHGASRAVADQVAAVLRSCDTARFASPVIAAGPDRAVVARLIDTLEDDLCDG